MYTELTEDNLKQVVADNDTVIVQYSAGWCGNCRLMKPKFKKFGEAAENATFVMVDAEKFPESRELAEVNNLPTFAAFKGGELVKQVQTNKTASLQTLIDEVTNN